MVKEKSPKVKKKSFFAGFVGFINQIMPKKEEAKVARGSRFDLYIQQVDPKDESFELVKKAAEMCDEALLIAKQRMTIIKKVHQLDEKMIELDCYEKLTEEEIAKLKDLTERFISLNKDRNVLRYQMTGFDKGLVEMEKLEEDAKYILKNIEYSETNQKILRKDINLVQGEKSELEFEYEQMTNAQAFIRKLSTFLVIFFGFVLIGLSYNYIVKRSPIFLPTAVTSIFLIIIISLIYIFQRRIKYELKVNLSKQHRAVEIINKKSVIYAYHTNFLRFVYKKYNVKSSDKLKKNIKDFNDYKSVTHRFDSIRNAMYQTEYDIENFLREKNISNAMITIEKFAKTIDIDDKRKVYNDYKTEKNRISARLNELDKIHEGIWNDLVILGDLDKTPNNIVERIMQHYIEEVSQIAKANMDLSAEDEDSENELAEIMRFAGNLDRSVVISTVSEYN